MTINAALIGVGKWGQRLVRATQDQSESLRFTTGVTRTVSKAAAFCQQQGMSLGNDLGQMLKDKSIDMAVICTPHTQRAEIIEACLAAGKHVFVIKPLTMTLESAKAVSAAADKAGVKIGVGFPWRHLPATKELKRLAATGELGAIGHVESNYCVPRFMNFKPEDWKTKLQEQPPGALTTHAIDVLTDIMGPVETVNVLSHRRAVPWEIDDTTAVMFRFANGASGFLGSSGATAVLYRLMVFGSKAWAEVRNEARLEVAPTTGPSTITEFPDDSNDSSLRWELESFADSIQGKDSYPWSRTHDLHGVAIGDAIVKSARDGGIVKVET
jgi:predicted dehydrogenase